MHVDIIKLYGSMELAPLVGLSDAIVELCLPATHFKADHLEAVERIIDISSRLVVNKAALKVKYPGRPADYRCLCRRHRQANATGRLK